MILLLLYTIMLFSTDMNPIGIVEMGLMIRDKSGVDINKTHEKGQIKIMFHIFSPFEHGCCFGQPDFFPLGASQDMAWHVL